MSLVLEQIRVSGRVRLNRKLHTKAVRQCIDDVCQDIFSKCKEHEDCCYSPYNRVKVSQSVFKMVLAGAEKWHDIHAKGSFCGAYETDYLDSTLPVKTLRDYLLYTAFVEGKAVQSILNDNHSVTLH